MPEAVETSLAAVPVVVFEAAAGRLAADGAAGAAQLMQALVASWPAAGKRWVVKILLKEAIAVRPNFVQPEATCIRSGDSVGIKME